MRALLHMTTMFVLAGIVGCAKTDPAPPEALVIHPGAYQVSVELHGSIWQAHYRVDAPYPAKEVLAHIGDAMTARGWRPLHDDFLNPGLPSSHVTGWAQHIDGTRQPAFEVHQWLAQWASPNGEVIWYALRYSYPQRSEPDLRSVQVFVSLNPPEIAQQQLRYVEKKAP